MGERRGETDHFRLLVDRCRLDGRALVAAKHLAYDIEAARERGIAKRLITFAEVRCAKGRNQRFLRIGEFGLRLRERGGDCPDRFTGPLHCRSAW
jgi:hypothetical protein